ncbi:MAG: hypothetical protein LUC50_08670 [Ruminococcus sp.]|nr:hypothetical protein [Ruminococcus sp.]
MKNHTSTWLGSRLAAYVFDTYFQNNASMMWETDLNARTISLKKHIVEILQRAVFNCNQQSGLRGSLSRTFPTTVSLIAVECSEDQADAVASNRGSCYTNVVDVQFWWAGDSRGFILDENGLVQVAVDDIDTHKDDAFVNLCEDD